MVWARPFSLGFFNSILHTFLPKGREAFRLPKVPNMVGLRRLGYNVCNNPIIKKTKLSSVGNEMSQSYKRDHRLDMTDCFKAQIPKRIFNFWPYGSK